MGKIQAICPSPCGVRDAWRLDGRKGCVSSIILSAHTQDGDRAGRGAGKGSLHPTQCLEWVRPVQKFATDLWSRLLGWLAGGGIATVTSFQGRNGGGWGQA